MFHDYIKGFELHAPDQFEGTGIQHHENAAKNREIQIKPSLRVRDISIPELDKIFSRKFFHVVSNSMDGGQSRTFFILGTKALGKLFMSLTKSRNHLAAINVAWIGAERHQSASYPTPEKKYRSHENLPVH
jgi:hypothetical protein